jgi:SAM-dependent methyltransferase
VSIDDQQRWDRRYLDDAHTDNTAVGLEPPAGFAAVVGMLPAAGTALDLACGAGGGAVWLARRGLDVVGIDVSRVAVGLAEQLASSHGVEGSCRFVVHDFDLGLPETAMVDLITCHLFSAPDLDDAILGRLVPGGILAITVLSEVGGETGPFRARPAELLDRFGSLDVLHHHEAAGRATLVGVATGPPPSGRLD